MLINSEKNINAQNVLKCYSFWDPKAGPEHWPIYAHFAHATPFSCIGKVLEFFSKLPNPGSANGETIQSSLNYWNRKGLIIWSMVEKVDFLFKWNLQIYVHNNLEITLKIMKIPRNLLKNLEILWKFVSPEKSGNPETTT